MKHLTAALSALLPAGSGGLTVVSAPDGFLARPEVQAAAARATGRRVMCGTALALRMHYELDVRPAHLEADWLYILTGTAPLLPDIARQAQQGTVGAGDIFSNFDDLNTLRSLPADTLEWLLTQPVQGHVTAEQLRWLLSARSSAAAEPPPDYGSPQPALRALAPYDWAKTRTVLDIADIFVRAVKADRWEEIAAEMADINADFQRYLAEDYFDALNASPYQAPRSVKGIVPYMKKSAALAGARVALVVVDGMAFWQYAILRGALRERGVAPAEERWLYAWLPSVTMLSRQAIFRGDTPRMDYAQSPQAERRLWRAHWEAGAHPQYLYDGDQLQADAGCRRLAVVTVELDKKMHAAHTYRDLLALTALWAPTFAEKLADLKRQGFTVVLTTDHGNVLAHGLRPFSAEERAYLYDKASRGHRHAIFKHAEAAARFAADMHPTAMLHRELWFALTGDESFNTRDTTEITHGGAHLFEVMIPFVIY